MEAFGLAAQNGNVKHLKEIFASLPASESAELAHTGAGKMAVFLAASTDNALLSQLLQAGFDASHKSSTGETALHVAVKGNEALSVEALLKVDSCDPNAADGHQQTAIHRAGEYGFTEILRLLISCQRVNVNAQDAWYRTALHWASVKGYSDRVQELIARGANATTTVTKDSVLHWAVRCEDPKSRNEIVQLLLSNFSDVLSVYAYNDRSEMPIEMARSSGALDTVEILQKFADEHGQTPPSDNIIINESHVHESGIRMGMKPKGGVRKLTVRRANAEN